MAVAFSTDLSTFVPERPSYAVGENSDGSLAWMTNQELSLAMFHLQLLS